MPKVARLAETVAVHSYDGNVKVREIAVVKIILDVTLTEKGSGQYGRIRGQSFTVPFLC